MIRGGSWNNNPANLRVSNRNRNTPDNRNNNLGFRLVQSARTPRAAAFTDVTGGVADIHESASGPCREAGAEKCVTEGGRRGE